jgi:hypothetical protein
MKKILVGLLVCLILAHAKLSVPIENNGDVKITDITPNVAVQGEGTKITVKGEGFSEDSKVLISPTLVDNNLISTFCPEAMTGFLEGNIAFVGTYDGLAIFDISDIEAPQVISKLDLGDNTPFLVKNGNYIFAISLSKGLVAIDISNLNNPFIYKTIKSNYNRYFRGLTLYNNQLFVNYMEGDNFTNKSITDIIDISNLENILYYTIDNFGEVFTNTIAVKDDYMFLSTYTQDSVIDVSDPKNLKIVSNIEMTGSIQQGYIFEDYLYVSQGYDGFNIIDISDINNPIELSHTSTSHYIQTIIVKDNDLFISDGLNGIYSFDITDKKKPKFINKISNESYVKSIDIQNDVMYTFGYGGTARSISLTIPTVKDSIVLKNNKNPRSIYIDSENIYLKTTTDGVYNNDITVLTLEDYSESLINGNMIDENLFNVGTYASQTISNQGYLYEVLASEWCLKITNINTNENIKWCLSNYTASPSPLNSMEILDNTLYLGSYYPWLFLIDITNPMNPILKDKIQTLSKSSAFDLYKNNIVLTSDFLGLHIIENPVYYQPKTTYIDLNTLEVEFPDYTVLGKYSIRVTNDNDNYSKAHGAITLISLTEQQTLIPKNLSLRTIDGQNGIINIDLNDTQAIKLNALLEFTDGTVTNVFTELNSSEYEVSTSDRDKAYYFNNKLIFNDKGKVTITITAKGFSDSLTFSITDSSNPTTFQDSSKDAIIILGHLDDKGGELSIDNPYDKLRFSINKIGNNIYKALSMFGIDNIHYFNPNGEQKLVDHDNDKIKDNAVDHINFTWSDVVDTINSLDSNSTDPLILWMVDHGEADMIKIGANESVTTTQIQTALDNFQSKTGRTVIAILDACYSGSIANAIKKDNRVIISSSDSTSVTYMDPFGDSFSYYLLNYLKRGASIKDAFDKANEFYNKKLEKSSVSISPLYFNKNTNLAKKLSKTLYSTIPNPTDDDYTLSDFNIGDGEPLFLDYTGIDNNITLETHSQELKVKTDHPYPSLAKLYALISPPNPVEDVGTAKIVNTQMIELYLDSDGYSKNIYNFNIKGDYTVTYVLEDDDGNSYISDTAIFTQTLSSDENGTTTITLSAGWNLVALDSDLDDLNDTTIIWQYDDKWKAYSPNKQIQTIISNMPSIGAITEPINSTNGTWMLSDAVQYLDINTTTASSNKTYQLGWNLAGTNTKINIKEIECSNSTLNSIWKYKNNYWMLRTDKPNTLNLESFDSIEANEGFWVECK